MLGKVGYQVSQVKDQVGQGQGQELDNVQCIYIGHIFIFQS